MASGDEGAKHKGQAGAVGERGKSVNNRLQF